MSLPIARTTNISHVLANGEDVKVTSVLEPPTGRQPAIFPSFGEYPVYDESIYQVLSGDAVRNGAFNEALRRVASGNRVLDIGTGSHLKWAREAIELGAKSAVGIESIKESFAEAQRIRHASGMTERLDLIHGLSTDISLTERADICVAEIIGSLAGAEGAAVVIRDARQRLLSARSLVVPHRATTQVAAACLRDLLGEHPIAFSTSALPYLGKIFSWNGGPFDVRLRVSRPHSGTLLSDSAEAEVLDFNGDICPEQMREIRLNISRRGNVDGLLAWMRLWCDRNGNPIDALRDQTSWASVYFPLFDESVHCQPGDCLRIAFRVRLAADQLHPIYQIDGSLVRGGRSMASGQHVSNFGGNLFRQHAVYQRLFPV